MEDTVVLQLNTDQIDSLVVASGLPSGLLQLDYGVDVHRVVYVTPDVDGVTPTTASGLIMIPWVDTSCAMPMMAYLHGTSLGGMKRFTICAENGRSEQLLLQWLCHGFTRLSWFRIKS